MQILGVYFPTNTFCLADCIEYIHQILIHIAMHADFWDNAPLFFFRLIYKVRIYHPTEIITTFLIKASQL